MTIREDVPEVGVAGRAAHFGAAHEERAIVVLVNGIRVLSLIKARPAGARFELCIGFEQRRVTAHAMECAVAFLLVERAAAGAFGAVFAGNAVLLWRQLLAPFSVSLFDPGTGGRVGHFRVPLRLALVGVELSAVWHGSVLAPKGDVGMSSGRVNRAADHVSLRGEDCGSVFS